MTKAQGLREWAQKHPERVIYSLGARPTVYDIKNHATKMFPSAWTTSTSPFISEDTLHTFVRSMTKEQAGALYAMLYNDGVRYDPDAIRKWRKGLGGT